MEEASYLNQNHISNSSTIGHLIFSPTGETLTPWAFFALWLSKFI
jgi:hypothetical protein